MNLGFLTKDVRISKSKFASVVILVSASFAWLFMFFNWFRDIFEFYIPNAASVNNGYFLFLGAATFSAILGSVLSERINRRKFLVTWIFIGLISNIFLVFTQELGLISFYIISAVLGISIALGFPDSSSQSTLSICSDNILIISGFGFVDMLHQSINSGFSLNKSIACGFLDNCVQLILSVLA